jgi:transposase
MVEPEAVSAMLKLKELGWGSKRIARELGVSRGTVKRYLEAGGWQPFKTPERKKLLAGHEDWLRERLRRHRGNADVVRQELASELGIAPSLRTVQRALAPWRQEIAAEARATVRFETAPGKQLQIDFGERLVEIGGSKVKVFLFVATLGYSRLLHVRAFRHERQESWFDGLESAFLTLGACLRRCCSTTPAPLWPTTTRRRAPWSSTRSSWPSRVTGASGPRACAPYRARTKGKTESGVGYVKKNAIAGRRFASWEALEAHLAAWERAIANARVHGTTGDVPMVRFERDEKVVLKPLAERPPFRACRTLERRVVARLRGKGITCVTAEAGTRANFSGDILATATPADAATRTNTRHF